MAATFQDFLNPSTVVGGDYIPDPNSDEEKRKRLLQALGLLSPEGEPILSPQEQELQQLQQLPQPYRTPRVGDPGYAGPVERVTTPVYEQDPTKKLYTENNQEIPIDYSTSEQLPSHGSGVGSTAAWLLGSAIGAIPHIATQGVGGLLTTLNQPDPEVLLNLRNMPVGGGKHFRDYTQAITDASNTGVGRGLQLAGQQAGLALNTPGLGAMGSIGNRVQQNERGVYNTVTRGVKDLLSRQEGEMAIPGGRGKPEIVADYLKSHPDATPEEVARIAFTTPQRAGRLIEQAKASSTVEEPTIPTNQQQQPIEPVTEPVAPKAVEALRSKVVAPVASSTTPSNPSPQQPRAADEIANSLPSEHSTAAGKNTITAGTKALKEAQAAGHDITEAQDAFDGYRDIKRADFDNNEDYVDNKQAAWEEFIDVLGQSEKVDTNQEAVAPPTKSTQSSYDPTKYSNVKETYNPTDSAIDNTGESTLPKNNLSPLTSTQEDYASAKVAKDMGVEKLVPRQVAQRMGQYGTEHKNAVFEAINGGHPEQVSDEAVSSYPDLKQLRDQKMAGGQVGGAAQTLHTPEPTMTVKDKVGGNKAEEVSKAVASTPEEQRLVDLLNKGVDEEPAAKPPATMRDTWNKAINDKEGRVEMLKSAGLSEEEAKAVPRVYYRALDRSIRVKLETMFNASVAEGRGEEGITKPTTPEPTTNEPISPPRSTVEDILDRQRQRVEDAISHLPTVRDGYLRLYRGHRPEGGMIPTDDSGQWFTSDPSKAVGYAWREGEGRGELSYIDVPKDAAYSNTWADLGKARGWDNIRPDEYVLPREILPGQRVAARFDVSGNITPQNIESNEHRILVNQPISTLERRLGRLNKEVLAGLADVKKSNSEELYRQRLADAIIQAQGEKGEGKNTPSTSAKPTVPLNTVDENGNPIQVHVPAPERGRSISTEEMNTASYRWNKASETGKAAWLDAANLDKDIGQVREFSKLPGPAQERLARVINSSKEPSISPAGGRAGLNPDFPDHTFSLRTSADGKQQWYRAKNNKTGEITMGERFPINKTGGTRSNRQAEASIRAKLNETKGNVEERPQLVSKPTPPVFPQEEEWGKLNKKWMDYKKKEGLEGLSASEIKKKALGKDIGKYDTLTKARDKFRKENGVAKPSKPSNPITEVINEARSKMESGRSTESTTPPTEENTELRNAQANTAKLRAELARAQRREANKAAPKEELWTKQQARDHIAASHDNLTANRVRWKNGVPSYTDPSTHEVVTGEGKTLRERAIDINNKIANTPTAKIEEGAKEQLKRQDGIDLDSQKAAKIRSKPYLLNNLKADIQEQYGDQVVIGTARRDRKSKFITFSVTPKDGMEVIGSASKDARAVRDSIMAQLSERGIEPISGGGGKPPEPPKPPTATGGGEGDGSSPQLPQPTLDDLRRWFLNAIPELRKKAEGLFAETSAEKARRIGLWKRIVKEGGGGTEARRKADAMLAGEYPKGEVQLETPITQEMRDRLDQLISVGGMDSETQWLSDEAAWHSKNIGNAFDKMLSGQLPTDHEIDLIEEILGPQVGNALRKYNNNTMDNLINMYATVAGLPMQFQSGFDASFMMRQLGLGWVTLEKSNKLGGYPILPGISKAWINANKVGLEIIFGHGRIGAGEGGLLNLRVGGKKVEIGTPPLERAKRDLENIKKSPYYGLMKETMGIEFINPEHVGSSNKVDEFMSQFGDTVPVLNRTQWAFVQAGNRMRFEYAKNIIQGWEAEGMTPVKDLQRYKDLGRAVNYMTGRGTLMNVPASKDLKQEMAREAVRLFNIQFYSPRFLASRVQILGMVANPATSGAVRKLIIGDMVSGITAMLSIMGTLKLFNVADIETDPRSTDFLKIKMGDSRIDPWAGFLPIARYIYQGLKGEHITATGEVKNTDLLQSLMRFWQSKLAPLPGAGVEHIQGHTFNGDQFDKMSDKEKWAYWSSKVLPLGWQDVNQAIEAQDKHYVAIGIASLLGWSAQYYSGPEKDQPGYLSWKASPTLAANALEDWYVKYGGEKYKGLAKRLTDWNNIQNGVDNTKKDRIRDQINQDFDTGIPDNKGTMTSIWDSLVAMNKQRELNNPVYGSNLRDYLSYTKDLAANPTDLPEPFKQPPPEYAKPPGKNVNTGKLSDNWSSGYAKDWLTAKYAEQWGIKQEDKGSGGVAYNQLEPEAKKSIDEYKLRLDAKTVQVYGKARHWEDLSSKAKDYIIKQVGSGPNNPTKTPLKQRAELQRKVLETIPTDVEEQKKSIGRGR